jgi:adenylate cyclase
MRRMPRLSFPADERAIDAPPGATVLEAALLARLPIAHACGGQARCSTCRVLVLDGADRLGPPSAAERELADRRRFGPGVRLACQAQVLGDASVRRLVLDDEDSALVREEVEGAGARSVGDERRLAILFADVRDFTPFTESQSPYDVVHVLNRFFARLFSVVLQHGGVVDAFLGDGALCLFGIDGAADPSGRAVHAALAISAAAKGVATYVESTLHAPFRVGVGVHTGEAIVGVVGAGDRRRLTAIGDAVNVASRVEASTKAAGADLLVSDATMGDVAGRVRVGRRFDVPLKGKSGHFALHEVLEWTGPDRDAGERSERGA